MSEHRYDIRISEAVLIRIESQDPDNFPRLVLVHNYSLPVW